MKKKFWIAVDEDGEKLIYDIKPIRQKDYWSGLLNGNHNNRLPDWLGGHLNLTWESEPYEIEI